MAIESEQEVVAAGDIAVAEEVAGDAAGVAFWEGEVAEAAGDLAVAAAVRHCCPISAKDEESLGLGVHDLMTKSLDSSVQVVEVADSIPATTRMARAQRWTKQMLVSDTTTAPTPEIAESKMVERTLVAGEDRRWVEVDAVGGGVAVVVGTYTLPN